jgi:hypothetical protein
MDNNNLPDFETLFGAIEFKEGDPARSVYSPAAYLTDLLQLMTISTNAEPTSSKYCWMQKTPTPSFRTSTL